MLNLFSVAEPADRHALRASAISCSGLVGIGLCTDPDAVPGVSELAAAIEASLEELRAAAAPPAPPTSTSSASG